MCGAILRLMGQSSKFTIPIISLKSVALHFSLSVHHPWQQQWKAWSFSLVVPPGWLQTWALGDVKGEISEPQEPTGVQEEESKMCSSWEVYRIMKIGATIKYCTIRVNVQA